MARVIVFIFILSFPGQAILAQDCKSHEAALIIENDSTLTLGGGTDRYYSNGFEAFFKCHTSPDNKKSQSNLAFRSLNWFGNKSDFIRTSKGLRLGQKIYTSSDLTLAPNEIDTSRDRPYAGWTYASFFHEAETLHDRYLKHEFSIGCVGPCSQAENMQTEWHEFFGFVRPEGWDLQIKNQVAIQYFLEYKTNRYEVFPHISLHPRYKVSLGTVFNDLSFGGEFIIGDKSNEQLNKPDHKYKKWGWQFFLHNDIKLVAFNGTLEGSMFNNNSPHTVNPSRVILENGLGVRLNLNNQYSFEYRFIGRSTENEEQDWKFWDHKYGSFEFGFGF
ncbi:MAG: lipid A deacylase LpxR family protein [Gammaproteobacteria bacterium]|nr:lipid A deacylase LpxR family protein [Gammaproteobacteria bacterium]